MEMETWKNGEIDMKTWNMEKWRKETWRHRDMDMETRRHQTEKTEARAIFLNLFTVCSSCKWKFVVCPFVDEETDGIYPFANGLNGLNGLAHLCIFPCIALRTYPLSTSLFNNIQTWCYFYPLPPLPHVESLHTLNCL
jgi:hypothetical protein